MGAGAGSFLAWLTIGVSITFGTVMAVLAYLALRKGGDRDHVQVFKDTMQLRIEMLESKIMEQDAEIESLKEERKECRAEIQRVKEQMDAVKEENRLLLHQLLQLRSPYPLPPS